MNKKRFWPFLLLIPLAIAVIAGWFLLPDTLVMQVGMSGQPSKSMPKVLGLLIPMAAGMIGAAYASSEREERRPRGFCSRTRKTLFFLSPQNALKPLGP